jgi:hypothetical protein
MLIMGAIVLSIIAFVVQFLWNVILVKAVGVSPISYWHALGLFVLSRILFGHYRFGPGSKKWRSNRKKVWRDKWMHMDDAEKTEMREKWREWCRRRKEG